MATDGIHLDGAGKRFGRQWVVRNFSATLHTGRTYGVAGRNGSGKSTLIRMLAGQLSPSEGSVTHTVGGKEVSPDQVYRHVSWTGPYLEVVEELSIDEFFRFHFSLKPLLSTYALATLAEHIGLAHARRRKLEDCSSGMRQRVLLATALYADTAIVLLDEPTLTLDTESAAWFYQELRTVSDDRIIVVASNDKSDLEEVEEVFDLS